MIKYKQAKHVFKSPVVAKTKESEKSNLDWLGTIFKFSALLLLVVYLFAYGAAVGYASYFGIPQSTLYSSPTDLLGIASETIFHFTLHFFSTGGTVTTFWSFFESEFDLNFVYLSLVFGAAWFVLIYLLKHKQDISVSINKGQSFFFPKIKVHLSESKYISIIRSLGYGILASTTFFIVKIALFASILTFYLLILIAPVFGYSAAIKHAERDIIDPKNCDTIKTRVEFKANLEKQKVDKSKGIKVATEIPTANCVKVTYSDTKGSKTIAGRSVLAGSDYILIYETSGKATRIPLKTAVIEVANDAVLKEVELQNEKLLAVKAQ